MPCLPCLSLPIAAAARLLLSSTITSTRPITYSSYAVTQSVRQSVRAEILPSILAAAAQCSAVRCSVMRYAAVRWLILASEARQWKVMIEARCPGHNNLLRHDLSYQAAHEWRMDGGCQYCMMPRRLLKTAASREIVWHRAHRLADSSGGPGCRIKTKTAA